MLRLHDLPPDAARAAINDGDFPAEIVGRGNVAIVMTQDWCPDWMLMRSWLIRMERANQPSAIEIDAYLFVYNKADFFSEFMGFKENSFGNYRIPYVRYDVDGEFTGDSNQLSADRFLRRFNDTTR